MHQFVTFLALVLSTVHLAVGCTIVNPPSTLEALKQVTVVFRGTVLASTQLPSHPKMGSRQRYAIRLSVSEYWKGDRGKTITLYDLSPGTDCIGHGFERGREYLIFATQEGARDYFLGDDFWFGWADVLPPGTMMLQPIIAGVGGATSAQFVRQEIRELGHGLAPKE